MKKNVIRRMGKDGMKAFSVLLLLLSFVHMSMAQEGSSGPSITDLFNSLKSTPKAVDKERYMIQIESLKPNVSDRQNAMLFDVGRQIVAVGYAEESDFSKALLWSDKIEDNTIKGGALGAIASGYMKSNKYEEARQLLASQLQQISFDENGNAMPQRGELEPTLLYGEASYHDAKYEDAIRYLSFAMVNEYVPSKYKELCVLAKLKSNTAILLDVENMFMAEGHRSQEFKSVVKTWLTAQDGDARRYEQLVEKATRAEQLRMQDKVLKMTVDRPAPDFEIKDVFGQPVSLASLRGKTVILDFWATWCQPCIASFPGMQRAVDYFANDSDVVFMFIHTAEKKGGNATELAQKLIQEKGYRFDVYMDLRDPATGKCPVAEAFGVKGIPAKFVIDKEGVIKFGHTGFVSEEEAIEEIKMMVELANR